MDLMMQATNQGLCWQLRTWNMTNPTPLTNANYLPDTEYMVADNAEALIALWDGESRGTKHMIDIAKRTGLLVHVTANVELTGAARLYRAASSDRGERG